MAGQDNIADLWLKVIDIVKDRVNNRTFWHTIEQTVGITQEGDTIIVGLPVRIFNQSGFLNSAEHRNAIEFALRKASGQPLKYRMIEGETLEDWETTQKREARVAAMQNAVFERRDKHLDASESWDALNESIGRVYANIPMRTLPQNKARYLTESLYLICDALDSLYGDNPDENTERMLGRTLERVAQNAEVPGALVAIELERLRVWRKANPE